MANMHESYIIRDRDMELCGNVKAMIALRRYDTEFSVLGTVFMSNDTPYYLISQKEDKIYSFMNQPENVERYPFPCMSLMEHYSVPAGFEEEVANKVKLHLAEKMQKSYPENFLRDFYTFASKYENNIAYPFLLQWQRQLEGVYQEDQLKLFEGAVWRAKQRKVLTDSSYYIFQKWIEQERREMADDFVAKDIFEKTYYGLGYLDEHGRKKIFFNTSQALVYQRLEQVQAKNILASTIVKKTYWYNYTYRLIHVRHDCKHYFEQLFNQDYFLLIKQLYDLPVAVEQHQYNKLLQQAKKVGEDAYNAVEYYGAIWGCLENGQTM